MTIPESQQIHRRFFEAIYELINRKQLRGKKTFVTRYGLNLGNFYWLEKDQNMLFQPAYLTWLVRDYGISSQWLLTGEGPMFQFDKQVLVNHTKKMSKSDYADMIIDLIQKDCVFVENHPTTPPGKIAVVVPHSALQTPLSMNVYAFRDLVKKYGVDFNPQTDYVYGRKGFDDIPEPGYIVYLPTQENT